MERGARYLPLLCRHQHSSDLNKHGDGSVSSSRSGRLCVSLHKARVGEYEREAPRLLEAL